MRRKENTVMPRNSGDDMRHECAFALRSTCAICAATHFVCAVMFYAREHARSAAAKSGVTTSASCVARDAHAAAVYVEGRALYLRRARYAYLLALRLHCPPSMLFTPAA